MKKTSIFLVLVFSICSFGRAQVTQEDHFYVGFGEVATINPISNDYDTLGHTFVIDTVLSDLEIINYSDSTITFRMIDFSNYYERISYRLKNNNNEITDWEWIYISPNLIIDTLNCNDIKAAIYPGNLQFYDAIIHEQMFQDSWVGNYGSQFFYPANEETRTVFNYCLWFGGINSENDSLHIATELYSFNRDDFIPGPLPVTGMGEMDSISAGKWFRTWKIKYTDIEYHQEHYQDPNYEIPEAILSWPAHGDVNFGYSEYIAPFVDVDLNTIYEPEKGDYPKIKGDETIFFVYNDKDAYQQDSEVKALGIEIHCMAWAYKNPEQSSKKSTIFYSYKLFNRSNNNYRDAFIGVFSDMNIGDPYDDYIGSNVKNGYFYSYNGSDYDQNVIPTPDDTIALGYHSEIPSQAICVLSGPFMDEDYLDNESNLCDESINGSGFGDGIIDNERLGMSYFMKGVPESFDNPYGGPNLIDGYLFMQGKWRDSTQLLFGGNGHYVAGGNVDYPARFAFSGDSDSCHYGTYGIKPYWDTTNIAYEVYDTIWTEETAQNHFGDRRGVAGIGPFTFEAGSVEYLDIALVTAPGDQGKNSKDLLEEYVEAIRAEYIKNPEEFGNQYLGAEDIANEPNESISIFPNPSKGEQIYLNLPNEKEAIYYIYNPTSQLIQQGFLSAQKQQEIDISKLPPGWFVLEVIQNGIAYRTKLIKH